MDVRFCSECRNQPPRGIRAQQSILIGRTTRSQERERMTRAFLLTKTYMEAGDTATTRHQDFYVK
jgi:hypothetical protein